MTDNDYSASHEEERRDMRFLMPIVLALLLPVASAQGGDGGTVSGVISSLDAGIDQPVGVPDAEIQFQSASGETLTARTDKVGQYAISLLPGSYVITVSHKWFCGARRPPVSVTFGVTLKFDFTLTSKCVGDAISVGRNSDGMPLTPEELSDELLESMTPSSYYYYAEQKISFSKAAHDYLIISFGKRLREGHQLKYYPLPVSKTPGVEIPVTISFGRYTVRAKQAEVGFDYVRAEQSVSIEDGSSSPPQLVSCAEIRLDEPAPQPHPCS